MEYNFSSNARFRVEKLDCLVTIFSTLELLLTISDKKLKLNDWKLELRDSKLENSANWNFLLSNSRLE